MRDHIEPVTYNANEDSCCNKDRNEATKEYQGVLGPSGGESKKVE
jgi:hypothetical protein